jgi:hypothetical protein
MTQRSHTGIIGSGTHWKHIFSTSDTLPYEKRTLLRVCVRGVRYRSWERNQTSLAIFSALVLASSSVPTYMNADSGRSSPSPLQSRSKESIVSSSEV